MPIVASCDDEPPEPLIEDPRDDFNSVTLVAAGIALRLSPPRLPTARLTLYNKRVKTRDFRPARSHNLVATFLDEGYAIQRFASLWRDSIRSLPYRQPYLEISRVIRLSVDAKTDLVPASLLRSVAPSPTPPELPVTSNPISIGRTVSPRQIPHFCIPCIIITPPPNEEIAFASLNMVPTPQDAAQGNFLTVPDPDLEVINHFSHERTLFDSSYLRRERLYSYPGACKKPRITLFPARKPSVVTRDIREPVPMEEDEDEDEMLDLGPTWCG